MSAIFDGKEYERNEISHFIQHYGYCDKCQGWEESFVQIDTPPVNFSGQLLGDLMPTGLTLTGRSNHRRACPRNTP